MLQEISTVPRDAAKDRCLAARLLRARRVVWVLLLSTSAICLLLAFLARLGPIDGFQPGSATALRQLDLDGRLGQMLVGLAAVALTLTAARQAGASRKYGLMLAACIALVFVARLSPHAAAFVRLLRVADTPGGWHGLQLSSVILFVTELLAAALLAVVFYRWVVRLSPDVRIRIVGAALLFGFGAIGIEAISEWSWYAYGARSFQYATVTLVEEIAETAGLVLFIDALAIVAAEP